MGMGSSLWKGPVTTPVQLLRRLEQHDWLYAMSDDHRSWQRGNDDWEEITAGAKIVPNGAAILKNYVAARNLANYGHK